MDSLYNQKRQAQFRGPQRSDDYNANIEEVRKDLVNLYNKSGLNEESLRRFYQRLVKEMYSLVQAYDDLDSRIESLEDGSNSLTFFSSDQIDNDRFNGSPYEVVEVDRCAYMGQYGILTLPKIDVSSVSKLKFINSNGEELIPSSFETVIEPLNTSADGTLAVIDTSEPYFAVINETGKIWERNVIVDSPDSDGAQLTLYVRLPADLSSVTNTNCIIVHPYPVFGVDLMEVAYSTEQDAILNSTETYTPIVTNPQYIEDLAMNDNDLTPSYQVLESSAKIFYFDPKPVTAVRFKLRQNRYYTEGAKFIYSYGMSKLDVRFDKFLDSGKAIIRFDAPGASTISNITEVLPKAFNVYPSELSDVLNYRIIWETAYNSGVYTLTPVPFSKRVWLEVSLNKTRNGATPTLSELVINYT